jgi:hypothetical protein
MPRVVTSRAGSSCIRPTGQEVKPSTAPAAGARRRHDRPGCRRRPTLKRARVPTTGNPRSGRGRVRVRVSGLRGRVPLDEVELTHAGVCKHETQLVIARVGNPKSFFPTGDTLGEGSQLGVAPSQEHEGYHGGDTGGTEATIRPLALKGDDIPVEVVDPLTVVAEAMVGEPEREVCRRLESEVSQARGNRQRTPIGRDDAVRVAQHPKGIAQAQWG